MHRYIEITIRMPAPVTFTADVTGALRLRVNERDLTATLISDVQDALYEAGVDLAKGLDEEKPRG
jgi:hypothetical protein